MAEPVRVRRLTDQEGQQLQRIVRRGSTSTVRYRRAMMLLASAGGNRVPVIARLVQADEDTVRDVGGFPRNVDTLDTWIVMIRRTGVPVGDVQVLG
ncbi:IS630 family transposase, partial [Kitasatospora sp. NPDC058190]